MARTEAPLRTCMIVQQLQPEYYAGWSDVEIAVLATRDAAQIGGVIRDRLVAAGIPIAEWHCIVHDADTRLVWDDTAAANVVENKPAHFHMAVKFEICGKYKGATLPQIAAAVGVEPQYIEKAKRGANAWDNMLAYLIHIKYPNKHQYSPAQVASGCGRALGQAGSVTAPKWRQYQDIYAERREEWLKGRAAVKVQQAKAGIDDLEERILTGEISRDQVLLTDEFYAIYARNKRRCDDAFACYADRKIMRAVQAMRSGEFRLSVFYVTGKSNDGKSYFTDRLAERIQAAALKELGEKWTVCGTAATNPMDKYDGSEILVMDDLRGMAMTAADWLKLLDPDRANDVSARYHNKMVPCRVIIINSTRDILDFFYYLKGSGGGDRAEAMDQFFRRILAHVTVYRVPDDMDVRRVQIGQMHEKPAYTVAEPGSGGYRSMMLRYGHDPVSDMDYEDALDWLATLAMSRSGVGTAPVLPVQTVSEPPEQAEPDDPDNPFTHPQTQTRNYNPDDPFGP